MTTFRVRDGQRILQFDGELIGKSTSERPDEPRWIEFRLYRTDETGQYILSRIGFSNVYHLPDCLVAQKSRLDETPRSELTPGDQPCRDCNPHMTDFPLISFEREKHWARVYRAPEEVLDGLMKEDPRTKNRYMTAVARRLLEDAGVVDDGIYDAEDIEIIR